MLVSNWSQLLSQLTRAHLPPGVFLLPAPVPRHGGIFPTHPVGHCADVDGKVAVEADMTRCSVLFPTNTAHSCETPSADLPKRLLLPWDGGIHARTNPVGTLKGRVVKLALAALCAPELQQFIFHGLPAPLSQRKTGCRQGQGLQFHGVLGFQHIAHLERLVPMPGSLDLFVSFPEVSSWCDIPPHPEPQTSQSILPAPLTLSAALGSFPSWIY